MAIDLRRAIEHARANWLTLASHDRRIGLGFLWVSMFVLVGKLAGAGKEMAVAWRYGAGPTVDAYVFVLNIVTWPVSVWFSVLTVVLVPLVAELRHGQLGSLLHFQRELAGLTLLIGLATGVVIYWALPWALGAGLMGLHGEALDQAIVNAKMLTAIAPLGIAIGFYSAWMMANGKHKNTLLEAIPALLILAAVLLPASWIPSPLIWGTVAGYAAQLVILSMVSKKGTRLPSLRLSLSSPAWTVFFRGFLIMALGQAVGSFAGIIDQFFAAGLPSGSLASLSYANRILALMLSMGAIAISRATLPVLSEIRTSGSGDIFGITLRWSILMFFVGLVGLAGGILVAQPIVTLLFERGAFTAQNSATVATVLSFAFTQLPFYFSSLVMVSAFSAAGYYRIIALGAMLNLVTKTTLCMLLVGRFQAAGLVLATAGMYFFSLLYLLSAAWWLLHRSQNRDSF